MNEKLTSLLSWLDQCPPAAITILAILSLGYVLKTLEFIPNRVIPLILFVAGGPTYYFISRASVRTVCVGFVLAWIAWLIHNRGLAFIEDKIPGLRGLLNADRDAAKDTDGQETSQGD